MTIKCQVCGTENADSNKYCDGCGVELTPAASAPATPVPAEAEKVETPSAPTSEVTPPADAASVPAPDASVPARAPESESTPDAAPVTPLTPPETIGSGSAPNPYQTPLNETPLGQTASTPAPAPVETTAPATPAAETPASTPVPVPAPAAPAASPAAASDAPAKLGLKKFGQPTGEFIPLQGEKLVVGRFDASSGPVDIDLGEMAGKEHISRHHAELYREGGVWHVRDLGSTNGVFLKKKGESTFSPRLQEPAALADGDELAFGNVMLTFNQS